MCSGATWKREVVPDHKFDFVDTREFTDNGFGMRMKYLFLYLIILKSFLVYVSDIFSAITMLTTSNWSNDIYDSCQSIKDRAQEAGQDDSDTCIVVDFHIGKWVFFGSIILGFLLLAYESRKAKKIIASRDISYAFTNVLANNYYSLRSYDHFCFFDHISNSTKRGDDIAFFVFFTFKGWKRLLLSDGPRQAINGITLYSFFISKQDPTDPTDSWDNFSKYFQGRETISNILMCTMIFTVLVFACSLLLLAVAGLFYIPLLCHVQGNLKEYVCHKVDKRIAEIIRRRNRQRQAKAAALARKEAAGDFSHLKGGGEGQAPLPQPTLPNISLDDDELDDGSSMRTRGPPPSTFTHNDAYYGDQKTAPAPEYAADYPPMPAYGANGTYGQHGYEYGQHGSDYHAQPGPPGVYGEREPYFGDGYPHDNFAHDGYGADPYASNTHVPLAQAAAPHAGAHDVPGDGRRTPPGSGGAGLAYEQDYPSPTSAGPPARSLAQQQQQAFGTPDGLSYDWNNAQDVHGHGHGHGYDAAAAQNGRGYAM